MVLKELKFINAIAIPSEIVSLSFDSSISGLELKRFLKNELNLPNLRFRLFVKFNQKYNEIQEKDFVDDSLPAELKAKQKPPEIHIRQSINMDKFNEFFKNSRKLGSEEIFPYGILSVDQTTAEQTRQRLIEKVQLFLENALYTPETASFAIPSRSSENIGFDETSELVLLGRQKIERAFRSLSSVKSVEQLSRLMVVLEDVLARDIHMTKRDIFYRDVKAFDNQGTSDNLIDDLSALLNVTRPSLNVSASSKGIVVGHIEFEERGDYINCQTQGMGKSISPNISDITNLQSDAEFVLVIEKDAVFNRLAEDQFYDYIPSIIITAKGQPDMATRMFLKKIDNELQLPIVAIMDADVYGFEILRVYSVGSKSLSFEATNLAVPNIKWMGLLPSDLKDPEFKIPASTHLKLTKNDENKIKTMLDEEFVKRKPEWVNELKVLQELGVKAEIQALNDRDPQFITNHYLPYKLEQADFI